MLRVWYSNAAAPLLLRGAWGVAVLSRVFDLCPLTGWRGRRRDAASSCQNDGAPVTVCGPQVVARGVDILGDRSLRTAGREGGFNGAGSSNSIGRGISYSLLSVLSGYYRRQKDGA